MRKFMVVSAAVMAALGVANAADAQPVIYAPGTVTEITPPASGILGNTFSFATSTTFPQTFDDWYEFNILDASGAVTDSTISTISLQGLQNINFDWQTCSIYIDTPTDGHVFQLTSDSTAPSETWSLVHPLTLDAGMHTLYVNGDITAGPIASYSGTINFLTPAVPEPATWGMMLLGFAGMGMAMRRRASRAIPQIG